MHISTLMLMLVEPLLACGGGSTTPAMTDTEGADGTSSGDGGSSSADGASTGAATESESESTGEDEAPTAVELCEASCAWQIGCEPGGDSMDYCVDSCLEEFGIYDEHPTCDAAVETLYMCLAEAEACEPDAWPEECIEAEDVIHECELMFGCASSFGVSEDQSSCFAYEECNLLDPVIREMECDAEICTCTVDGRETGQCPSQGLCMSVDPLDITQFDTVVDPFIAECCGWDSDGEPGA